MKRHWTHASFVVIALSLSLAACSSGAKKEGEAEEIEATDAGTDAVPAEGGEQAAAAETPAADQPPATDAEATTPPATESAAAAPAAQGSGQFEDYAVQEGDTLMKIAFETYGDIYQWKAIFEANKDKITSPNSIPKGTTLKLEKPSSPVAIDRNGDKYLIQNGDTLGKISDEVYGTKTKWKKLWENNRQLIKDPNRIFAGFFLYYTMSPEEKQEADQLKQGRPAQLGSTGGADPARQPATDTANAAPAQAAAAEGTPPADTPAQTQTE